MFSQTSEGVLGAVVLTSLLAATELGFALARRRSPEAGDLKTQSGALQASLLGLLALLLGFTLSMAVNRYEHRKALVLEESNAISTTYLRAGLLAEPLHPRAQDLLRAYVDARIAFYASGTDDVRVAAALRDAERLHRELWAIAVQASAQAPSSVSVNLFVQSLNDVIDLHEQRVRAREDHVPESVLLLSWLVAFGAFCFIGYDAGLAARRRVLSSGVVAALVTMVLMVIVDLDRPRRGVIRVSQAAMEDLKRTLAR